ncbi:MAG: NAD(P)-dependent oxidoreductase [Bacteroidia bacterium]|nr:NAD(P)-dependent oxidoreductase [Bacteroidia bacterium]MDW8016003.1 NAD(P)-dependent oxidoreductase [Bacteroidia bacterium]
MRVLITGSRGLVGYHVIQALLQRQAAIFSTSRGEAPLSGIWHRSLDLTDQAAVHELIRAIRPTVVIHSAAMALVDACQENPPLCWHHNVNATRYLLEALVENAPEAHFIFVSTDFVYDGFPAVERPYVEGDYEAPLSVYGASKLAAEAWVRTYPGTWTIVRTALVYGWAPTLSRDNVFLRVINRLSRGEVLELFTDQVRTPTWAMDLAEGLVLIAVERAQGLYHVAGGEVETPYSFGQKVARLWGLPTTLLRPITARDFQPPAPRPPYSPLSIEKARSLGYRPHSTEEALQKLRQVV